MPKNKKAVSRSRRGKKALVEAPPEQSFWMSSGLMLPNLRRLEEALRNMMTDEEYAYHANRQKNDFAKWVAEVLRDAACAQALRRAKTRRAAATAVARALKQYE